MNTIDVLESIFKHSVKSNEPKVVKKITPLNNLLCFASGSLKQAPTGNCRAGRALSYTPQSRARVKHPDLNCSWPRVCWAARLSESSCHVLCTNKRADSVLQAIQDTFVTTRDEQSTHTGTENQMEKQVRM